MFRRIAYAAVAGFCAATLVACGSDEPDYCRPHGAIGTRYAEIGAEAGPLGRCTEDEYGINGGRIQDFEHGAMYWTNDTGAWEVYGDIGKKYAGDGGPASAVGWPVSGELSTPGDAGRFNRFQHGNIYASAAGTHPVYGAIFAEWGRHGFEQGRFGFPTTDEFDISGGRQTNFQGGWIRWLDEGDQIITS